MARLYADENFPLPVVHELRQLGHDVVTVYETGKGNLATSDAEILALAIAGERAILTLNRKHFIRLHATSPKHTGIVVCPVDPDFAAQAWRIHIAITGQNDLSGLLIRISRPSS